MNQTTRLEWGADEGTQAVLLRIYVDGRRTSAYIPVAYGKQDGNVSESVWQEAQAMYEEEFRKPF